MTDTEPLILHNPRINDLRYSRINPNHPTGKTIMRHARAAAANGDLGPITGLNGLRRCSGLAKALKPLEMDALNALAAMYMIVHPTVEAGATGKGAIWAVASEIVNEQARAVLRDRPMFELVD